MLSWKNKQEKLWQNMWDCHHWPLCILTILLNIVLSDITTVSDGIGENVPTKSVTGSWDIFSRRNSNHSNLRKIVLQAKKILTYLSIPFNWWESENHKMKLLVLSKLNLKFRFKKCFKEMLSIWKERGEGTCATCCRSKAYLSSQTDLPTRLPFL